MKISVWVTVSDLVPTRTTLFEKIQAYFDKKHKVFNTYPHTFTFQSLKQAGVNGIELLIPLYTSDTNITEVKKIITKNSIPVFSIHQPLTHSSMISLQLVERLCTIANIFSCSVIVLHSGSLNEKLLNKEFLDKLKKLQKKYGVSFGIENMDKSLMPMETFTYKGSAFSTIIKESDLSITFDTTHLAQAGENITDFYLTNKERIVNIHLSDYKKNWINKNVIPQISSHLPLGKGTLPIQIFLKTLKKEHYNGIITMEINGNLAELCESANFVKHYTR